MANLYPRWTQVRPPSGDTGFISDAGNLFNQAIQTAQRTVAGTQAAQQAAQEKAQAENLRNLQVDVLGSAQQGLESFSPLQEQLTPQALQSIYGENIDPLKAFQAVQSGRGAAVESTGRDLLQSTLQRYQDVESSQQEALPQAYAQLTPQEQQFVGLDQSGNVSISPTASQTPAGVAAVNRFRELSIGAGAQSFATPGARRSEIRDQLISQGATATEASKLVDATEQYRSTLGRLDSESQQLVDAGQQQLTAEREGQLAAIDQQFEDRAQSSGYSLDQAKLSKEFLKPTADFIKERWPESEFLDIWVEGGTELLGKITELAGEKFTPAQINQGLAAVGEIQGDEGLLGLIDPKVDPQKAYNAIIRAARGAQNEDLLKRRASLYEESLNLKKQVNSKYTSDVKALTQQIKSKKGFSSPRTTSDFLRAQFERQLPAPSTFNNAIGASGGGAAAQETLNKFAGDTTTTNSTASPSEVSKVSKDLVNNLKNFGIKTDQIKIDINKIGEVLSFIPPELHPAIAASNSISETREIFKTALSRYVEFENEPNSTVIKTTQKLINKFKNILDASQAAAVRAANNTRAPSRY